MKVVPYRRYSAARPAATKWGFTLIELMVVMVLIAILTAMIVPEMKGTYQDALLRSTSRELVNVFQLANSRAVTHNQIHRVRLEESSGRYITETQAGLSRGRDEFVPLRDVPGSEGKLDSRISVALHRRGEDLSEPAAAEPRSGPLTDSPSAGGENAVAFYPDGTADDAEVELRDPQGFCLVLRINRVTARVHIVERPRE